MRQFGVLLPPEANAWANIELKFDNRKPSGTLRPTHYLYDKQEDLYIAGMEYNDNVQRMN